MMLHYLFTNDLRRNEWPDILVESAKLIRDEKVPDQNQDKSKNNYINTQQSYLCIHKGSNANWACCNGNALAVILNFIDRFQFPNARTQESFNHAIADGMAIAPLRLAVQLLFALNLIDGAEAHISREEFVKYIICNKKVASGGGDVLALARQIVSDREAHVKMPPVPDSDQLLTMGIEWKHCPRQINELFKILQFAPFVEAKGETEFSFVIPKDIDASMAKMFFYLVNNRKMWEPPPDASWIDVQKSYLAYMDSGIVQYQSVSSDVSDDYREEFISWMVGVERKSKSTAENYISYLSSLNKSPSNPINNHSTWPGVYPYLFGVKSPKEVYEVGALAEFDEVFGPFRNIFDGSGCPNGANPQAYQACVTWASQVASNACLDSAFKAYRKFLIWREEKEDDDPRASMVDLLTTALKIFEEKRYEEEWQEKTRKDGYQNVYAMADMTPEQIAAGSLDDFYNDFLLKIWAFQNGGCRNYGQLDETGKTAYRQFVVDLKTQLKSLDAYFPPNKKCPTGMGVGMLTEIMTRFWPKTCCNYNESLIHDAMVTLGLFKGDFVWPKTPSIYQDFMGKCATILRKMEQMKLPRRPEPGNDEPPDYITVNEFLWFVHDYKDLIKEEVMKKQMKEVHADVISAAGKKLALNADSKEDLLMLRLMSSLRAKPFVILAGHSGTGKSRIVRKLAYMTCNVKELQDKDEGPLNFCMVQVKPNWHDSADLLGYRSAIKDNEYIGTKLVKFLFRAYAYPNTPFFLCLDEMNLAPVEQYFAEFLSAMESLKPVDKDDVDGKGEFTSDRVIDLDPDQDSNLYDLGCEWTAAYNWVKAHGFTIPKNLFVVGTVNMDETTCQFSRKVLDRAMTIEMTDASFADYGKVTEPDFDNLLEAGIIEKLIKRPVRIKVLDEDDAKADSTLMAVQRCLEKTPFAVAFRFANEYMLYKRAIKEFDPDGTMKVDSLDHVVLMKVLPRISGEKGYVANIFIGSEDIKNKLESPTPDSLLGIFKETAQLSHGKMIDILSRKASYLTFWP